MRIVLLSSSFHGGGITSYAKEFISCFAPNNECHVIIGDDSYSPIGENNVMVYHYDSENLTIPNATAVINLINNTIKPDIVIGSNSALLSLVAPYIDDSIKVVLVSHSLKYFEADLAARPHRYVDKIVALSGYNKDYLIRKFHIRESDKVVVVYNFVHGILDADLIRNHKKDNTEIIIVNPGGAHPSKNPALIVRVIRELCKTDLPFKFYWLGNTHIMQSERFFFSRYHDVAQLLPNDSRVVLTGKISRSQADNYISNCNIFFFPSIREGCSMSLLEAMRVGVISLVSDDGNSNKEIIKNGYNGFVLPSNDPEEFIKIIKEIICSHPKFSTYYDNSYSTFVSLLSRDVWIKKMKQVIYDKENYHHRRKSFHVSDYIFRRLLFKCASIFSKIRIIVEENIKTIIQFNSIQVE